MDPAHRFSTPEIQEVFARAAAAQERDRAAGLGLTVEELQEVGAEAGLDPAHVAAAARAVASGEPDEKRETLAGLPVGVRRAVTLDAPPSEALWEHVVADLQETFAARGKTERIGASRTWRNSNLRATLGPSGDGARLRLQTNRRDDTRGMLVGAGVTGVLAVVFLINGGGDPGVMALVSSLLAAVAVVRQATWARTRERQMEDVAARAARTARALATEPARAAPVLDLLDLDDDDRQRAGRRRTRG